MNKALLNLSEAATMLSVSRTTLRRIIVRGEIRVVQIGGLVRVPASELHRWIADETVPFKGERSVVQEECASQENGAVRGGENGDDVASLP